MTKSEFEKLIKSGINDLPTDKQLKLLEKIENDWIPDIKTNLIKNKRQCEKCKVYVDDSKYKIWKKKETIVEVTYSDAGYGDGDKYGEVEYLIDYIQCPLCKHIAKVKKHFIRILWEKGRHE